MRKADKFDLSLIKRIEVERSKIEGAVSLAQGIPGFPAPMEIREYVADQIKRGKCDKYSLPMGITELREELALSQKKEGLTYNPETEIIVTAGALEGITSALLALLEPGDEVLIISPAYAAHYQAVMAAKGVPKWVFLNEDLGFSLEFEELKKQATKKTKAVLLTVPNNPTGTVLAPSLLKKIVKFCLDKKVFLIVDEVYKEFYYSGSSHFSPALCDPEKIRVIRVCSFSKAFCMTGWRVGFISTGEEIAAKVLKYHDTVINCAPLPAQYGALAALKIGEKYIPYFQKEFKKRRDYTIEVLDSLSHFIDYQLPEASYFVFPRIKDNVPLNRDSRALAFDILERAKVAVVPGIAFGPSGEGHLRLNFGRSEEELRAGLERFAGYFLGIKKLPAPATALSTPKRKTAPLFPLKSLGKGLLLFLAKAHIAKNKPLIIGIVGLKGKTFYKREIAAVVRKYSSVKANILSFNTPLGMALSIFNVNPLELSKKSWLRVFLSVFKQVLSLKAGEKILVLEYGFEDKSEAEKLLKIAVPNWLVVTSVSAPDPQFDLRCYQEGLKEIIKRVPAGNVIWIPKESLSFNGEQRQTINCVKWEKRGENLIVNGESYGLSDDLIGESALGSRAASILLAKKLFKA